MTACIAARGKNWESWALRRCLAKNGGGTRVSRRQPILSPSYGHGLHDTKERTIFYAVSLRLKTLRLEILSARMQWSSVRVLDSIDNAISYSFRGPGCWLGHVVDLKGFIKQKCVEPMFEDCRTFGIGLTDVLGVKCTYAC